jgi:class 3 adenylate cyclase
MDGKLRKALEDARGQSESIFAVVADIREFSLFSKNHESPDVATYIKRVYIGLIDNYFPFAKFYKATGDGLLIAVPFDAHNLQEVAQKTVGACLNCVSEFADICHGDPMVNFATPDKIGFGIARGTACCLVSRNTVLDYSGHLLNLASRLMDHARPSGIVLDGAFGIELLDEETQGLFVAEKVCMRSVAETEPVTVYTLKGVVEIPEEARRPLSLETWEIESRTHKVRHWRKTDVPTYAVDLPKRLKRSDGIIVELRYRPRRRPKTAATRVIFQRLSADAYVYTVLANQPCVFVKLDALIGFANQRKLTAEQELELRISYVPE